MGGVNTQTGQQLCSSLNTAYWYDPDTPMRAESKKTSNFLQGGLSTKHSSLLSVSLSVASILVTRTLPTAYCVSNRIAVYMLRPAKVTSWMDLLQILSAVHQS